MGFFSAGHSHADYLSFDLSLSGVPYVIDVGTYSYHDSFWRNYGRGTRAHNTVTIDGRDQVTSAGSFSWQRVPTPGIGCLKRCQDFTLIRGTHIGYPDITHTRIFIINKTFFLCLDQFLSTGHHHYEFNYHIDPGQTTCIDKREIIIHNGVNEGIIMIPFMFQNKDISIHRACHESGRGFSFPIYGEKSKIDTVTISEEVTASCARGMLFVATKREGDKEVSFIKESLNESVFSFVINGYSYRIQWDVREKVVGFKKEFVVDCDFLLIQLQDSKEICFFAVGVSTFSHKGSQCVRIVEKLDCLLLKQEQGQSEVFFGENAEVIRAKECEDVIFH